MIPSIQYCQWHYESYQNDNNIEEMNGLWHIARVFSSLNEQEWVKCTTTFFARIHLSYYCTPLHLELLQCVCVCICLCCFLGNFFLVLQSWKISSFFTFSLVFWLIINLRNTPAEQQNKWERYTHTQDNGKEVWIFWKWKIWETKETNQNSAVGFKVNENSKSI